MSTISGSTATDNIDRRKAKSKTSASHKLISALRPKGHRLYVKAAVQQREVKKTHCSTAMPELIPVCLLLVHRRLRVVTRIQLCEQVAVTKRVP